MAKVKNATAKLPRKQTFEEWAFESSGRNPLSWDASAKDLLEGAKAIGERVSDLGDMMHTLAGVQAMLLGLAIECLLKGIWIKSHKAWLDKNKDFSLTKNGQYVGIPGAGDHELLQLARASKVKLSVREGFLLGRLTDFVKYAGRYPIPTRVEQAQPIKSDGKRVSRRYLSGAQLRLAENLAARLRKEVLPWN